MTPQQVLLKSLQGNNPTPSNSGNPVMPIDPMSQAGNSSNVAIDPSQPTGSFVPQAMQQILQERQAEQARNAKNEATLAAVLTATQPQAQAPTKSVDYNDLKKEGYTPAQISSYVENNPDVELKNAPKDFISSAKQDTIIPEAAPLTETFGQIQPGVEVFSHGVTTGTGIGVKAGTPLALPPGKWQVVQTYSSAPQKGYIGNSAGQGWGNYILVKNQQSGDYLRYSHLSQVGVAPGDTIGGNHVIGLSGQSGNTTGDHLNLEYLDQNGTPQDVLKSSYSRYLPIKQQE